MGLGKTIISLTAINDLIVKSSKLKRALIIAPLRVANTVWQEEAEKWEHLQNLTFAKCTGNEDKRVKAVREDALVTIINRENIPWLVKNCRWVWDMVIVDESTSFKSTKALRFKALAAVLDDIESMVLLTGTPIPNGYEDLFAQFYLLDQGKRLGGREGSISEIKKSFYYRYFYPETIGYSNKYPIIKYRLRPNADKEIEEAIRDISISTRSEDYLELPERIFLNKRSELPTPILKQYKDLEKRFVIELNKQEINVKSASELANKLLQFCNGFLYDENKKAHITHKIKIDMLKEILEDHPNENFLIAYNYNADKEILLKHFPHAKVLSEEGEEVDDWNKGKIKLMITHPASSAYGLNLQYGGSNIVWYGLNWSLDLYQQFNARLHRQGQTKSVKIIHLVIKNAIDERVVKAIANKAKTQDDLLNELKTIILEV